MRDIKALIARALITRAMVGAILAASAVMVSASADAENQFDTPTSAATGFYTAYLTLEPAGVPDGAALAKLEPSVSPTLGALLKQAQTAEAKYKQETNGESPPLIEGDLFTSLFEGAKSFQVGTCSEDANKATCKVALTYTDPQSKPVNWTDNVMLVRTMEGGWRVDDIAYGANWDFGNKGKLSETLNYAITTANEPVDGPDDSKN